MPLLAGTGAAFFAAGACAGAAGGVDLAELVPNPPKLGVAAGVGVLAASDGLLMLLCPNPEKPVELRGEPAAGLAPNAVEPKAGLLASCAKEKGLFAFGAEGFGFSGEP